MSKFELKLSQVGKQRFAQTAAQLRMIPNPRRRNISIAWVTTPVAALAGILLGLGIQIKMEANADMGFSTCRKNTLNNVIELPEYYCYDHRNTIQLPDFEYIIN